MKQFILKSLIFILPFGLIAEEDEDLEFDQLQICFAGTYFLICKAMMMAQDHNYPYVKILSYDVRSETERLTFIDTEPVPWGERFEDEDEDAKIEIICFKEKPDCTCICIDNYVELIENYRLLDDEAEEEDFNN